MAMSMPVAMRSVSHVPTAPQESLANARKKEKNDARSAAGSRSPAGVAPPPHDRRSRT